jgi:hypothetical protein
VIDSSRARLEEHLEAVAREDLLLAIGGARQSRVGALHQASSDLFALDRVTEVQRALAGAVGDEARRIRYLLRGLAEGRATFAAAGEIDQYFTWRSHAHVTVGETTVPIGGLTQSLAETRDPEARNAVEAAWLQGVDAQEPVLEGAFSAICAAVEELGYGDFMRSSSVVSGVDLHGLEVEARRFLDATEAVYMELLEWHMPRLTGVERRDGSAADVPRLERAELYDSVFAGGGPAAWASALIAASGFDPTAGGRLRLHALPDGLPAGGKLVYPIRVPDEVVVLHGQRGGRAGRAAALRGLGAGSHAVHSDGGLAMELRLLGDPAVPQAFGLLFESVLGNRAVFGRQLRASRAETEAQLRLTALLDLLSARSAAARLAFELWWHAEPPPEGRGARYAEELTRATGLRHDPRAALAASLPPFQSATDLRARQLADVLAWHVRERCDDDWSRNPEAAALLTELMSHGRSFTADELAVQLGAPRLAFDRFLSRVEDSLR